MAGEKARIIYCRKITTSDNLKIYMASSTKGAMAVSVSLVEDRGCIEYFREVFPSGKVIADEQSNNELAGAIKKALMGEPYMEGLSLDVRLTPFQRKVLEKTAQIPFGRVSTYGEIARLAGSPGGGRAVGQVMNKNPLPIIFPCHRVVASNGLGGFGGGLNLKKFLLEREGSLKHI